MQGVQWLRFQSETRSVMSEDVFGLLSNET